jgi:hypothetical protein
VGGVGRAAGKETVTVTRQKFPLGVMVFGAIGLGFKSEIIRSSQGVDSSEYMEVVLICGLRERGNELFETNNWYFMQDGARCHTVQATMSRPEQGGRRFAGPEPDRAAMIDRAGARDGEGYDGGRAVR